MDYINIDFTMDNCEVTAAGYLNKMGIIQMTEFDIHMEKELDESTQELLKEHALFLLQENYFNGEVGL